MAKTDSIQLTSGETIPILYEDRSVVAIDKPPRWMLAPYTWQKTNWNLQPAIDSAIQASLFWARSRNLKFLRAIHRLDSDTTGVLLFGRSPGAVHSLSKLFESRSMEKVYLAVTQKRPARDTWVNRGPIGPSDEIGKMKISRQGKPAETRFEVLGERRGGWLIAAFPVTGRTHQIRVHLSGDGCPIVGDRLYNPMRSDFALALRAFRLAYADPFTRRNVFIEAPGKEFVQRHGFSEELLSQLPLPETRSTPPSPARRTTASTSKPPAKQ